MKELLPIMGLLALATPAAAQMQGADRSAAAQGAATITETDVARRIGVIAHDSMMGRDTPSRGLELTAQYIADEFKRFGLKPGGENGSWFQRYPIERAKLDIAASHVGLRYGDKHEHAGFDQAAIWRQGPVPKEEVGGAALLVAGPVDAKTVDAALARDRVVLLVMDFTKPSSGSTEAVAMAMQKAGARAFVLVSNRDSGAFAQRLKGQARERTRLGSAASTSPNAPQVPVIEVHERALAGALASAGVTAAEARASSTGIVRPLDGIQVMVEGKETVQSATAPNTIGVLEGSDPALRSEYIVFSAHMDHDGVKAPVKGDSIWNGADDDASGTIGVVELAEAFAQKGARPKRSIIFMTVSGEEKGLWGSRWFSDHPTVPVQSMVANINLDMIGRNWKDTIAVIGKEHSDLGATLNRVNAAHPELGMTAIDDIWPNERFYFRSDHFNFARKGVPILFFFNGTHEDYHQPTDTPDKIDAEKEARILKLVYYLGQEVGNAAERPKWKPESYEQIVEK